MYQCRLEAQPDHLTPAWLIKPSAAAEDAAELMFNAGIAQQSQTLWVPDPATRQELVRDAVEHRARVASTNVGRILGGAAELLQDLVSKPSETLERAKRLPRQHRGLEARFRQRLAQCEKALADL